MGLMVRSEIENGFGDADCKDRKDNEGGDGQAFQGGAFHFSPLRLKMAQTSAKRAVCVGE